MNPNPSAIYEHLERLERQNRRQRRLLGALGAALAWPILIAAQATQSSTVEVSKLLLRDSKGAVRAELATEADGSPVLVFRDAKGGPSMRLHGGPAGPILEMADGQGGSAWLASSPTGSSLSLAKGKGEIELATNATGRPSGKFVDKEGKVLWSVP